MKTFKILLMLFVGLSGLSESHAQERSVQEIHSMMVYNFMKYVNWPASSTSGDFVIGVLGENKVHETLQKWYGTKSKGSQKIVIKNLSSPSDAGGCHVLYIGKGKSGDLQAVLSKVSGQSTLVITDRQGLGKKGSGINFKTVNGNLKFELNQAAISSSNLKISSQLTGMAIII